MKCNIKIKVDDKELTLEEAENLFNELYKIFGNKSSIITYPIVNPITEPYQPIVPYWSYTPTVTTNGENNGL